MTKPIENNGLSQLSNQQASRLANSRGADSASINDQSPVLDAGRQDDAVTVSQAAEVLSRQVEAHGEGAIQTAEQAAHVAQSLRGLFEGNAGQALAAHTKNVSSELTLLLKAG